MVFVSFSWRPQRHTPTKLNPCPSLARKLKFQVSAHNSFTKKAVWRSQLEHIPHVLVFHYNYAHQRISSDVQDDKKGLHCCYGGLWWFRTCEHIHIFQSLVYSLLTVLSHLVRKGSACYNLFKWFFSIERSSALTIPLLLGQRWIFRTFLSQLDERELQHGFDVPSVIDKLFFCFVTQKAHWLTS